MKFQKMFEKNRKSFEKPLTYFAKYDIIISESEVRNMSKKKTKKEKLATDRKVELIIEAVLALAALIEAIKWW